MNNKLYVTNDNLITLAGLYDRVMRQFVNNATVTATVVDGSGMPVAGITQPITLAYVANSNGDYQGTLGSALAITNGTQYRAIITAAASVGEAQWNVPMQAEYRISS